MIFSPNDKYDILNDINRVEQKCSTFVSNFATMFDIHLTLTIKTNWVRTDIPTIQQMERIRSNLQTIARIVNNQYTIASFGNTFNYINANSFEDAITYIEEYLNRQYSIITCPIAGGYCANEPNYLLAERS